MNKWYYADVRICVNADSAKEAAQEINDAVSYVVHASGFDLRGYNKVYESDIEENE